MSDLEEYMEVVSNFSKPRVTLEGWVLEHGHSFEYKEYDVKEYGPKGAFKECFRNAAILSMTYHELVYVEGFAISTIPTLHAWCARVPDHWMDVWEVVDSTWDGKAEYFGIRYNPKYLRRCLVDTKTWGILGDYQGRFLTDSPADFAWKE